MVLWFKLRLGSVAVALAEAIGVDLVIPLKLIMPVITHHARLVHDTFFVRWLIEGILYGLAVIDWLFEWLN